MILTKGFTEKNLRYKTVKSCYLEISSCRVLDTEETQSRRPSRIWTVYAGGAERTQALEKQIMKNVCALSSKLGQGTGFKFL